MAYFGFELCRIATLLWIHRYAGKEDWVACMYGLDRGTSLEGRVLVTAFNCLFFVGRVAVVLREWKRQDWLKRIIIETGECSSLFL